MVPAHDRNASEIIISTVAVELDSEYRLAPSLRALVLFPSQVQLEARSMSLVEAFSSRAERRGVWRFSQPLCPAPARTSTYVTRHVVRSVFRP
jgi:hypothetical protein